MGIILLGTGKGERSNRYSLYQAVRQSRFGQSSPAYFPLEGGKLATHVISYALVLFLLRPTPTTAALAQQRGDYMADNTNLTLIPTTNEITVFQNDQFGSVRTIIRDGEPWFVAADVCRALELGDTHKAVERLDDDEKGRSSIPTLGGAQELLMVNEPGLYALVLGSRKPEAKAFRRWITHEVIPAIRKHGGYLTPPTIEQLLDNPDLIVEMALKMKAEREKRTMLE